MSIHLLAVLPGWLQLAIVVGGTALVAVALSALAHRAVRHTDLREAEELSAVVYQVVGTLYAILLGFGVVVAWQYHDDVSASVAAEAHALFDLCEVAEMLDLPAARGVRAAALAYAKGVSEVEWPALAADRSGDPGSEAVRNVVRAVRIIAPATPLEAALFAQTLAQLANWLDARSARRLAIGDGMAETFWGLLVAGAAILFALHGLFRAPARLLDHLLLLAPALMIGLCFYLMLEFDTPFGSAFPIGPDAFEALIDRAAIPG